jgi:hypothetical protein
MKVPKQRGPGQTGNTNWGHRSNRVNSTRRGGNPHAGGGGGGKKGCAVVILAGLGGLTTMSVVTIKVVDLL